MEHNNDWQTIQDVNKFEYTGPETEQTREYRFMISRIETMQSANMRSIAMQVLNAKKLPNHQ